jgi:hypothetical protein
MTSLLFRRDFFEEDVGWLEFRSAKPKVFADRLLIVKDLERVLLLDQHADFNARTLLEKRQRHKIVSVGYLRPYLTPLQWIGFKTVWGEPMISFYPCAAKRIRRYFNLTFQPPLLERVSPLVVYLERDNETPSHRQIIAEIEKLTLFGNPVRVVSVNPRSRSTVEMVRLMANASAVLGTEGAAFANILFMAPGSGVFLIENRGRDRFPTVFHLSVGQYLKHAFVHMKFLEGKPEDKMQPVDPKKIRDGFSVLLRRVEINRESQLLTGKIGEFLRNYDTKTEVFPKNATENMTSAPKSLNSTNATKSPTANSLNTTNAPAKLNIANDTKHFNVTNTTRNMANGTSMNVTNSSRKN